MFSLPSAHAAYSEQFSLSSQFHAINRDAFAARIDRFVRKRAALTLMPVLMPAGRLRWAINRRMGPTESPRQFRNPREKSPMAISWRSLLLGAATLLLTGPAFAQSLSAVDPAQNWDGALPETVMRTQPLFIQQQGPQFWVRGEWVFWMIGTGKLVEVIKEAYNSELFNSLLDATGKSFKDVAQTMLGNERNGVRLSAGAWLDAEQSIGIESTLLYLNRGSLILPLGNRDRSPLAAVIPNTDLILERQRSFDPMFQHSDHPVLVALLALRLGVPAIDENRRQVVVPIGDRNLVDANMQFDIAAKTFWIFDLLGRAELVDCDFGRIDAIVGYRRVVYSDYMRIHTQVETLALPLLPRTQISSLEEVRANNSFDGVLIGMDLAYKCGPWTLAVRPTATVAQLNAIVQRESTTIVTFPEARRGVFPGGTMISAPSIGNLATTSCTVIPEVDVSAARQCGEHLRLFVGSSLVYLPQVAYSPRQAELGIDSNRALADHAGIPQRPAPTSPNLRAIFTITTSVGLELRF